MVERYKAIFESIHLTRSLIVKRRVSKLVAKSYTLVTNYSEVTHSVRDDLSLYLDYSPENPLLNYEEGYYQSFQISMQTWFTEYVLLFNWVLLNYKIHKIYFLNVSSLFKWVFMIFTEYC
jgi:hypothetical protein